MATPQLKQSAASRAAAAAKDDQGDGTKVGNSLKNRKRTKTGCLTCRKRRIKCDEQRPTCTNCTKSRRECEGYQARLQFRHPLNGDFNMVSPYGPLSAGPYGQVPQGQYLGSHNQYAQILPRPFPPQQRGGEQLIGPDGSTWVQMLPAGQYPMLNPGVIDTVHEQPISPEGISHQMPPSLQVDTGGHHAIYSYGSLTPQTAPPYLMYQHPLRTPMTANGFPTPNTASGIMPELMAAQMQQNQMGHEQTDGEVVPASHLVQATPTLSGTGRGILLRDTRTSIHSQADGLAVTQNAFDEVFHTNSQVENLQATAQSEGHYGSTTFQPTRPGYTLSRDPGLYAPEDDEDPYDIDSDEDMTDALAHPNACNLPMMLAVHPNFDIRAIRSHDTFLNTPNVLSHYEPQYHASPLMNATTARIFGHFISVTACHLSLGQRRTANPSLLFRGDPVPKSQQGLWTYVLPTKALSNQGLLHAMLALASLQISSLQDTPRHAAMKHYHFAIRRIGKAVGLPNKRTSLATVAATLLLAQFEIWAAEHGKWNNHLAGARQLLLEIDYKGKTRRIKQESRQMLRARENTWHDPYSISQYQDPASAIPTDHPDEAFLEKIMGYKVPYGEDEPRGHRSDPRMLPPLTERDIDTYNQYCDLFWFFAKQDIFYSTISSNRLLLPFNTWGRCPPRAPLGRIDAVYGTCDHLLLLMGRVADFGSRDLKRKRKAVKANGGRWRPPPGMFPGGPPSGPPGGMPKGPSTNNSSNGPPHTPGNMPGNPPGTLPPPGGGGPPQGPGFDGMAPATHEPVLPTAYADAPRDTIYHPSPSTSADEIQDSSTSLQNAIAEWNEIQSTVSAFESALSSSEWQPLPISAAPPIATHFGSAMQYRDYRIADIWSMFYTAKIILARQHPHMPPAALMAAGLCAQQTATWANTVGRIVFGFQTPGPNEALNPSFGAALSQNMFALFFAGVQYRDAAQRLVTVQRLQLIAERIGHESAMLIASALEVCWISMYQIGKGPHWRRTIGLALDDEEDETRVKEFRTIEKRDGVTTVFIRGDDLRKEYSMGIMGLQSDFEKIDLEDRAGLVTSDGRDQGIRGTYVEE